MTRGGGRPSSGLGSWGCREGYGKPKRGGFGSDGLVGWKEFCQQTERGLGAAQWVNQRPLYPFRFRLFCREVGVGIGGHSHGSILLNSGFGLLDSMTGNKSGILVPKTQNFISGFIPGFTSRFQPRRSDHPARTKYGGQPPRS